MLKKYLQYIMKRVKKAIKGEIGYENANGPYRSFHWDNRYVLSGRGGSSPFHRRFRPRHLFLLQIFPSGN
jgi:hypothetical protein